MTSKQRRCWTNRPSVGWHIISPQINLKYRHGSGRILVGPDWEKGCLIGWLVVGSLLLETRSIRDLQADRKQWPAVDFRIGERQVDTHWLWMLQTIDSPNSWIRAGSCSPMRPLYRRYCIILVFPFRHPTDVETGSSDTARLENQLIKIPPHSRIPLDSFE